MGNRKLPGMKLSGEQLKAIGLMLSDPKRSYADVAEEIGVTRQTLYKWRRTPEFVQELLKQADVYHKSYLTRIDRSMIVKATCGDVSAADYLKDIDGRSQKAAQIIVLSPFEKFQASKFGNAEKIDNEEGEEVPKK